MATSGNKPRSKIRKSKCYCSEEKVWQNLNTYCQEEHGKLLLIEEETLLKKRKLAPLYVPKQITKSVNAVESTLPVERK